MLIADAHLDLALNAIQLERDLTQGVPVLRALEAARPHEWGLGRGTVALPEMRRGRVMLCLATVLARNTGRKVPLLDYPTAAQAYAAAQGHLAYYRALAAAGSIHLIGTRDQLDQHVGEWEAWEQAPDASQPPLGVIISMESADPVLTPDQLGEWQAAGLRVIGPAHYGPGRYAGGTGTELPLTEAGVALVGEMDRLGLILDLTHLSDPAFWQALDVFGGPVLASHNNCRALVPHQRQFDDAQLKAIITRNGVIGAAFDNWMIRPGWSSAAADSPRVLIEHVVDHIDHVCQLAGDARHAALGSDLDGGYGLEQSPADLDTIADLQRVAELLDQRGFRMEEVQAVMYKNWVDLLRRAWS